MKRIIKVPTKSEPEITYCEDIRKFIDIKLPDVTPNEIAEMTMNDLTILSHSYGLSKGLPCNENLSPFFFTGTCYIVDFDFEGMTDEQIAFAFEWLNRLKDTWK